MIANKINVRQKNKTTIIVFFLLDHDFVASYFIPDTSKLVLDVGVHKSKNKRRTGSRKNSNLLTFGKESRQMRHTNRKRGPPETQRSSRSTGFINQELND